MVNPSRSFLVAAALLAGCAAEPEIIPPEGDPDVGVKEKDVGDPAQDAGDPVVDTGLRDAGSPDLGVDAGADAVRADVAADVRPDASADVPADVRPDVPIDAGMDVPTDVRADVPMDAGMDAGMDVAADVRPDVAADAGPDVAAADAGLAAWTLTAQDHDCATAGVIGSRFSYRCAPGGTAGTVWGTDEYTHDSSVCTAAVHAGAITLAAGGDVTIEMRGAHTEYAASTRNGITSRSYGAWSCSFTVILPSCTGAGRTSCGGSCVDLTSNASHCGACGRACATGETCATGVCAPPPTPWTTNATDHDCATAGVVGSRFTYNCAPGGTPGSVWGTDLYTHDSSICTAAVHVGRITVAAGGLVTIQMADGLSSYTGSARNGVTTSSYGPWSCSYRFP